MRLSSLILSLCLHAAILLLILFWPTPPPLRLDAPPMMISLVDGAVGGTATPSPILGHLGEPGDGQLAPAPPAPKADIAAPAREAAPEALPQPGPAQQTEPSPALEKQPEPVRIPEPPKPEPAPKPEPPKEAPKKPEPKKEEQPKPDIKKPEPKKQEPPKQEPKKPEPKKPEPKKPSPPKKKVDPIAEALQQARKATSRVESGDRGNAVEQALAQARRGASGTRGGGGGEGPGPGGGGLGDVYIGQVMLAVRPNWGFASSGRRSLACVVKVNVDLQGNVQNAHISQSSGNAQFDASAVNAVIRTGNAGQFPPPPNQNYTDLDLVFTLDEMTGR